MKVVSWTEEEARYFLYDGLRLAKEFRFALEPQWQENEEILYNAIGYRDRAANVSDPQYLQQPYEDEGDNGEENNLDVSVNYVFKHWRFIHAQMSANPPTVQISPTSSDNEDQNAAEAADNIVNYARKSFDMQERFDEMTNKTLTKGIGWMKVFWNPFIGEVVKFDEETGDIEMSGAIDVYSPSTWDVWVDPDARTIKDIRHTYERVTMPLEQAISMFPEEENTLRGFAKKRFEEGSSFFRQNSQTEGTRDLIDVYEYYEKSLPVNGMVGRHAYHLEDGTLLRPMQRNPHYKGQIPLIPLTDIDVEEQVYGKSFIEYEAPIQDALNRLYGSMYDNVKAAGAIRWFEPEGCEIDDDSISDLPHERIRGKGNVPPHFINPPNSMPDMAKLIPMLEMGGAQTAGVNEAMEGNAKREMSGFSMQTAINAGNQTRRRLFNKFSMNVEKVYQHLLGLAQMHWDVKQTLKITGKGGAVKVVAYKGADISSGWDMSASYGESFSLDPASRREEIMELMPHLKEAGWSIQSVLAELRLNEVRGIHDRLSLAKDYQKEIFAEMIVRYKNGTPILEQPQEYQDHAGMLEQCYQFVMEPEFRQLELPLQELIKEHIRLREGFRDMDSQNAAASPAMAGPAPELGGGMVQGGAPMPAQGDEIAVPPAAPAPPIPQG